MKRLCAVLLAGVLAMNLAGCSVTENETTSLSLMEQVNDKNILYSDTASRLWYQISVETFADGNEDQIGDLKGVQAWLEYFSDGNIQTDQDMNMTGLFLKGIVSVDSADAVMDYTTFNKNLASKEDLQALCEKAAGLGMAVMVELDFSSFSKDSSYFKAALEQVKGLQEGQSLSDLADKEAGMFYFSNSEDTDYSNPVEGTDYYYKGIDNTQTPLVNQTSAYWKQLVQKAVQSYLDLGVTGFYLTNIYNYGQNQTENTESVNWFFDMVRSLNSDTYIVAASEAYDQAFQDLKASLALTEYTGVSGYLAKGVTGSLSAKELGALLEKQSQESLAAAGVLSSSENSLDLLKSESREAQLKMALALHILNSGQIFVTAGDELGLSAGQAGFISKALEEADPLQNKEEGTGLDLTFGSLSEQMEDGNSVLNLVKQAIALRDSYVALSSGSVILNESLSTDSVMVLEKTSGSSSVVLAANLSGSPQSLNVSSLSIQGLPAELGGILISGTESVTLEKGILWMPANSIAILK